jgi:hypothetical protein
MQVVRLCALLLYASRLRVLHRSVGLRHVRLGLAPPVPVVLGIRDCWLEDVSESALKSVARLFPALRS